MRANEPDDVTDDCCLIGQEW